jgi:hypothetical protein
VSYQDTKAPLFHFLEQFPRKRNIQLSQRFLMNYQRYFVIFLLTLSIVVSYNIANAQECKQLCIAEQFYQQGDTIVIFGKVDAVLENTDVLVQVYRENNRIHIAQVEVAQDGSYTHTFKADGPYFQIDGKYVVQVSYGPVNRYEISFDFQ